MENCLKKQNNKKKQIKMVVHCINDNRSWKDDEFESERASWEVDKAHE